MHLNPKNTVIGISDAEQAQIVEWFEELNGPCSESRETALAAQLSRALEGFMGIEREMLSHAFRVKRRNGGA